MVMAPRHCETLICTVVVLAIVVCTGISLVGFGVSLNIPVLYTIGAVFLLAVVVAAVIHLIKGIVRFFRGDHGREMPTDTRGRVRRGDAVSGIDSSNDGRFLAAGGFIANQSRFDLPPSYRSSNMYIEVKPGDDNDQVEIGASSPPPMYVDIVRDIDDAQEQLGMVTLPMTDLEQADRTPAASSGGRSRIAEDRATNGGRTS